MLRHQLDIDALVDYFIQLLTVFSRICKTNKIKIYLKVEKTGFDIFNIINDSLISSSPCNPVQTQGRNNRQRLNPF